MRYGNLFVLVIDTGSSSCFVSANLLQDNISEQDVIFRTNEIEVIQICIMNSSGFLENLWNRLCN